MKNTTVRLYDGSLYCEHCRKCPVVDLVPGQDKVVIHDPHKPESGRMTMTVEEYNTLLANAKPIRREEPKKGARKTALAAAAAMLVLNTGAFAAGAASSGGARGKITSAAADILGSVFPGQSALIEPLAEDPEERLAKLDQEMLYQAQYGYFDKVQRLLIAGARVDAHHFFFGATALMFASEQGVAWAVQMLIERGASVHLTDQGGRTALMRAADGYSRGDQAAILDLLLAAGAAIEAKDREGNTALMLAVDVEFIDNGSMTALLLDRKASPLAANEAGRTALMLAAQKGNVTSLKLLLAAGAEPNARDKAGADALMLAVEGSRYSAVDLLSSLQSAQLNAKDNAEGTSLLRAVGTGQAAIVKLLLERGADKNLPGRLKGDEYSIDLGQETALMAASREGKVEVVKLLIEKKADLGFKDPKTGHTALSLAKLYGADPAHREIADLLKAAGASR